MKRALLIIATAFVVTLAIIFGLRASVDALAVVLGVILGVVASVPTTFLVTYMLMRPRPNQTNPANQTGPYQPPIVVINSADPAKSNVSGPPPLPSLGSAGGQPRRWTVIGDAETEDE